MYAFKKFPFTGWSLQERLLNYLAKDGERLKNYLARDGERLLNYLVRDGESL